MFWCYVSIYYDDFASEYAFFLFFNLYFTEPT